MKWLGLLLALIASASGAGAQYITAPVPRDCVDTQQIRIHATGVPGSRAVSAVSTDGFAARLDAPVRKGAASILDDAALAWHVRTGTFDGRIACPGFYLRGRPLSRVSRLYVGAEVGNETGDPGPLRYLDPDLPNVDKVGPDYEAAFSVGDNLLALRWRDFLPTDPAIAPRIFDALEERFPKRKGLALHTDVQPAEGLSVTGDALIAEDLPFEETLGREVPTLRRRVGLGVGTRHRWWTWVVSSQTEWLQRPSWSRLHVPGPDWRETVTTVQTEGPVLRRPIWTEWLSAEALIQHRRASGLGLERGSVMLGMAGATLTITDDAVISGSVSAGQSGIGGELEGSYASSLAYPFESGRVEFTAARSLPEETPDLFFWSSRGYDGLRSASTPLELDGVPRAEESVEVRSSARAQMVSVSAKVRSRRGEAVLRPAFEQVEEAVAVTGSTRAVLASGSTANLEIRTGIGTVGADDISTAPLGAHVGLKAWARARFVLAGDDAFRAAREREPAVRLGALAEHSPDGRLNLRARLEWRSATHWEGWPEPDVPAALLLDLGGEYTFGAFTATLTGRNVLGAPEQTHPLGATLDGRLFVRLAARLGG